MTGVDHHPQPVHFRDPSHAQWTQSVPARRIGGRIGELVVAAVDRSGKADAKAVEFAKQRQVLTERIAILDALECNQFARRVETPCVIGGSGQADTRGEAGHSRVDFARAVKGEVARSRIALSGQWSLSGENDKEPAVKIAVSHAGNIELGKVARVIVAVAKTPAGTREVDRRIEVGIERQQRSMKAIAGRGGHRGARNECNHSERASDPPPGSSRTDHLLAATGVNARSR